MVDCWAKNISECCGTQSREHYVTKGLFSGKSVHVSGFPFLGGQTKEISLASLTIKNLCQRHNGLLSKYDEEAIKYSQAIEYGYKLSLTRRTSTIKKFSVHRKFVDLDLFNRWVIKTYLGFQEFFSQPSEIEVDVLAALIFSEYSIKQNIEYLFEMSDGEEFETGEVVAVQPILEDSHSLGMLFSLRGIRISAIIRELPTKNVKMPKITWVEHPKRKSYEIIFR